VVASQGIKHRPQHSEKEGSQNICPRPVEHLIWAARAQVHQPNVLGDGNAKGLGGDIVNPLDMWMMGCITAVEMLVGSDPHCINCLKAYRANFIII